MSIISEVINIADFIKELSTEATELQGTVNVADSEKYNIKDRFRRYKNDSKWLIDLSRECCGLASVRKRYASVKKRGDKGKRKCLDNLKYAFSDAPWKHAMVKKEEKVATDHASAAPTREITHPEVIITIRYHKPVVGRQKLSVFREIQVLGSTLLSELRDYLPCTSDEVLLESVQSLEEEECGKEKATTKSRYKSGYIFIEDTFYNDFRDPNNIDYSTVVLEWAKPKQAEWGLFKSMDMQGVRMRDLSIRQHKPYLYCHQGFCEHILTFTDIRLLNPLTDTTNPLNYPLETLERAERKPLCSVCHVGVVRWVVIGGDMCPEFHSFFCNSCMHMLHCTPHGKLTDPSAIVHLYPRINH